ncbi:hypothetical protein [Azospirillum sp.]|uniref:hypothetical protein n=1 Tax=Azospirillum sp. TaxID=34012 RepID=UPI002615AD63|nr:hypothetical protein [Azospirillum sp.]
MMVRYILDRAREARTWQGLTGLATLAGIGFTPDQAEAIGAAGVAVASLIGIFTKG